MKTQAELLDSIAVQVQQHFEGHEVEFGLPLIAHGVDPEQFDAPVDAYQENTRVEAPKVLAKARWALVEFAEECGGASPGVARMLAEADAIIVEATTEILGNVEQVYIAEGVGPDERAIQMQHLRSELENWGCEILAGIRARHVRPVNPSRGVVTWGNSPDPKTRSVAQAGWVAGAGVGLRLQPASIEQGSAHHDRSVPGKSAVDRPASTGFHRPRLRVGVTLCGGPAQLA